ncbi:MAG TPA: RNA-binding transcriptional accessory protein [Lachnospiraceae bacterium]|nr:RNA-binding transcriptional accessory protein [Lachnospiraceae bacterium]
MDIVKALTEQFGITATQAQNVISLLDEGNTIPFIARYRKEMTGALDDQIIRELSERLDYLRGLDEKRESVRNLITEQGNMTEEIAKALDVASTLKEIDDIYRPFRPKRRTKATIAQEKGLDPLAKLIFEQEKGVDVYLEAEKYVNAEKEVFSAEEAISGAKDIISEMISDNADCRNIVRELTNKSGLIVSVASDPEEKTVYEMYYDYSEKVASVASHRVLALNRGEKEEKLKVKIEAPTEDIINALELKLVRDEGQCGNIVKECVFDSYKRLIEPSVEREIRSELTEKAQEGAIKVFGENLKQLLLQPPIKERVVIALDPGYRNGCKLAVVDATGKVLDTGVIYPTIPSRVEASEKTLKNMIVKNKVNLMCIGNGTASRETEKFAVNVIKDMGSNLQYIMVNEAGASVYSASKLGAEEFPQYDVAVRSAISLARRVQDPLAELVKIEPKAIGVGQYQHDMNKKRLEEALGGVVESCVNSVGVDLNTASPSLLSYVSGITPTISKNILAYREENGRFKSRKELLKVAKLGPKAFEQCAGFLRVDGSVALDMTAVHPESYDVAQKLMEKYGYGEEDIKKGSLKGIHKKIADIEKVAKELEVGVPTLKDIIGELEKPGRDPRDDMPKPILKSDVLSIEDIKEGMILKGTVRNVIDFGVFVDIGVHQDGLVHISQICNRYIKHPLEAVSVGDIVDVKVIGVDVAKNRISLSMKEVNA